MLRLTLLILSLFSFVFAVFGASEAGVAEHPAKVSGVAAPVAEPDSPNLATVMAFLKSGDVVLRVGDLQLTWGELQPQVVPMLKEQAKGSDDELGQKLQTMLQRLALRGLYLQEARAQGIAISAEEKERSERELEASLSGNKEGVTKDSFIRQFPSGPSTLLKLNYEDAQKIVKLGNELISKITVSEQEITQGITLARSLQDSLKQQNDIKRKAILQLLKDPLIHSDAGFAKLAREYSEGVEAKQGGVLNLNFRRKELAEVNAIETFELQPGQTSGLYETDTAFRIMRVLKKIPAEKPEEEERLQMAQILFKKIPVSSEMNRDEIRSKILLEKQKAARDLFGRKLQKKHPVECILFPKGLW